MLPQLLALQLASLKNCGRGTVGSRKVPSAITVEGIVFTPKGALPDEGVCVIKRRKKPLMPTTPRRARLWLKEKRARVVCREPFTIQLRFATKSHVQPARVGVDTGSKEVGIAATTNGEVVFQAEVHLRDDIAGRREKGAFVIKDVTSGKKLLEITPRKLVRVARPTQGWMITRQSVLDRIRKESGASSPS